MTADQRPARPPREHGIDPAETLMDHLGLPRGAKYDFYDAALQAMSDEELGRFMEVSEADAAKKVTRPQFLWDTVRDAVQITFKEGTDDSKRVLLDERRFVDHDGEGNFSGVVLRDVSQGVTVSGLPEGRRISRMLRGRDITVVRPSRTARVTP